MKDQPHAQSRTYYYELLGLDKNATDKDIKKAYYRKSRQLHPDKGGNEEDFKNMKYAYDVLTDPKKRKAYDQYGEPGVKFAEGNVSMEAAMQLFLNLGACERLFLIMLVTIVIGYLLLFPILLSIRWDHPNSMTFAHVFIPIWLVLGLALTGFLFCVQTPTFPDVDEEDEDMKKEMEKQNQQTLNEHWRLRWGGVAILVVLTLLLLLLVLRLDRRTDWSYFLVIWPWILLELGQLGYKLWVAESVFLLTGHNPEALRGQKWLTKDWILFLITFAAPHLFYIAFACLLALKKDGTSMSWWEVFIPLWVDWVVGTVMVLLSCGKVKSPEELSRLSAEARAREETPGIIAFKVVLRCMWLGFLLLLCFKLSRPSSFPAWIIFLPLFIVSGCFCCLLSCILCCMSPQLAKDLEEADDEETAMGGAAMYGTMKS